MEFPQVINDNLPMLLALSNKETVLNGTVEDKEFYALLKKKLQEDLKRGFDTKDVEKRVAAFVDAIVDIREFIRYLSGDVDLAIEERISKTGEFSQRLVCTGIRGSTEMTKEEKIAKIRKYGEDNGFPGMNLKKDSGGIVYKTLGTGKEAWENMLSWTDDDNYLDLYEAVIKNDRA
jgi:predicted house-cleaning noncanonical NTP pyrophosphatase (MazG superfamily)